MHVEPFSDDGCCNLRAVVKRHGQEKCPMGFSVWVGVGTDDVSNPDKKRGSHSNHSPDGFEEAGLHRAFKAMADVAFPEGVKGLLETNDLVQNAPTGTCPRCIFLTHHVCSSVESLQDGQSYHKR
jgi:hypothetical protein